MTALVSALVVAALSALIASASRYAVRVGAREILTYSATWKNLTWALWLFPIGVAVAALVSPPDPAERWIPFALVIGFCAIHLPLTLEVFRREIAIADNGITQKSAWSRPVSIAWKDVREVAHNTVTLEVIVRSVRGTSIRISLFLSGMETLARHFEARLAHLPSAAKAVKTIRALRA